MELFKCSVCKKQKPKDSFYFNNSRHKNVHSRCKQCEKIRSELRKEYFREYMKRDSVVNHHKWEARLKARKFLTQKPCEVCGSSKSEAHHPDYNEPLKVIWLCHSHHWKVETGEIKSPTPNQ